MYACSLETLCRTFGSGPLSGFVEVDGANLKPKVWGQDFIEHIEVARSAIHQAHESENDFLVSV